jgi:hypothetical protein
MTKYTGPSIPYNGSHVHAVETLLGIEDTDFSYFNPGSYEIGASVPPIPHYEVGASVPPIPHYEVGASVPPIPHYEVGARASNKLLKIPSHQRSWPGGERFEMVDVQSHKRHYPDVWGELGYRSSTELIRIPAHTRSWPGYPEYEVDVQAHTRPYPDVWGEELYAVGRMEIGAASKAFDADPPRLTGKIKTFVKKGKLIAMSKIFIPATGGSMIVAIKIPMSTIKKLDPSASTSSVSGEFDMYERPVEIGWGWKKYVKKALSKTIRNPAFKLIAKKSAYASKYVAKKAKRVSKNPYVQKFAQVASVSLATSFGVPPNVTMAATDTLFSAMNGDAVSLKKVAIIAKQAAAGNKTAGKLKGIMTLLYKGGMKEMNPYLKQAQQAAQSRFAQTSEQVKQEVAKTLPSGFKLPGKATGMFPFEIPGFSYGPAISGWLYNIPYRSNLSARSIDTSNPFHLLRGAYAKGMA